MPFAKDQPDKVERRLEAWRLKIAGWDNDEIGEKLGVSRQTVHKWITTKLEERLQEEAHTVDEYREQQLAVLDEVIKSQLERAKDKTNARASDAANAVSRAVELKARLQGTEAPKELSVIASTMTFQDMLRYRQLRNQQQAGMVIEAPRQKLIEAQNNSDLQTSQPE